MRTEMQTESPLILPSTIPQNYRDIAEKINTPMLPICSKRYKAVFRRVNAEDKDEFKRSKVIIPISVGQKYHEEGEFEATLKLVDQSFKTCTILIADTLKRHCIGVNQQVHNGSSALDSAMMLGDKWFARNKKYISQLSIPCTISRWEDWRHRQEYFYYADLVNQLYRDDSMFRDIVHEVIELFLVRAGRQNDKSGEMFSCSLSFFLEESAVICLWVKDGFKFNVYPSGDNKAMLYAYEKCAKDDGAYRSLALNIDRLAA